MSQITLNHYKEFDDLSERIELCSVVACVDRLNDKITSDDIFNAAVLSLDFDMSDPCIDYSTERKKLIEHIEECYTKLGCYDR